MTRPWSSDDPPPVPPDEPVSFCVLLEITTRDAQLCATAYAAEPSAASVARFRHRLLSRLPEDVSRVTAVMEIADAEEVFALHLARLEVTGDGVVHPQPEGYVPPTRE